MKYFTILLFNLFILTGLNAQNSLNMDLRGTWHVDTLPNSGGIRYNDVWGYVDCNGIEYAILGSASYIHFISLQDPDNPVEVASFPGGQNTVWRDMKVFRDRAYAVSDGASEGMMIFDLSGLPYAVNQTYASADLFSKAHNIYIEEATGRAYVVGSNAAGGDVIILDLNADPDNPVLLANPPLPGGGYIHDIYVNDNIAYASHGYNGLYLWDLTDPLNPVFISSLNTGGYNHSSWVTEDGQYVVYAEEVPIGRPIGIIDISDIIGSGINLVTTFKFPLLAPDHEDNRPHNPYIRDNYIICSYYHDGLQIFDMSDPANPTQVAYYDMHENSAYSGYAGNWGAYPYLPSGLILASDVVSGLYVLEATDINFAAIEPTLYPDGSISVDGASEFCDGQSVDINITEGAENYKWFKNGLEVANGVGNTITAEESGLYYAEVSNGHCEVISEFADILVKENPDVSSVQDSVYSLCTESTIQFSAPEGYDMYNWFLNGVMLQNDNQNVLIVEEEGEYSLIANLNGCEASSAISIVDLLPEPSISFGFEGTLVLCEGVESQINVEEVANVVSIQWYYNGNPIEGNIDGVDIQGPGNYYAELTSANDCVLSSESVSVEISIPDTPEVGVVENLLTSTEASAYQWYLNGDLINGATEQMYEVIESGVYSVETFNVYGCNANSEGVEIIITGVEDPGLVNAFRLFPNPVLDKTKLSFSTTNKIEGRIEIHHIGGQLIETFTFDTNEVEIDLDVKGWAKGVYVVSIIGNEGLFSRKLVVE